MQVLPKDIRLLVLDYITLKSDLKAFCETSKVCRDLAVPRLYRSITLAIWQESDYNVKRFLRCIAAGARRHFRHFRCMTFEDSKPPEEPHLLQLA
jgi:hypothetical protein